MTGLNAISAATQWRGQRIFVLGDVMLDHFVYGRVERVSPEAPVPVLHFQSETHMLGGAANVVRNILALGGEAILAGAIGCDEDGDLIAGSLSRHVGLETFYIRTPGSPTTRKTRYISAGQQIMRLDVENTASLSEGDDDRICDFLGANLSRIRALVLSDYAKGVLSPSLVGRVIRLAKSHQIPIIVDPKTRDVIRYSGASVLTPNAVEAASMTGRDCESDASATQAARDICKLAGVEGVVLTRGARGMVVYDPAGSATTPVCIPTAASDVFDVSGAGDTVVATLALALSSGYDLATGARVANVAASIAVGKAGTAVVGTQELTIALKRDAGRLDVKIVGAEEAAAIISEWKGRDHTIGFANGCFDLLHPGHIELLRRAKSSCDKLIVALNSDDSVRRLKGEGRPIQDEFARAIVIASLDCVDLVTSFDDDTPMNLIALFKPDLLIKGADYTVSTVVGAAYVQDYGGKVLLVPLESGHSTSAIIARSGSGPA